MMPCFGWQAALVESKHLQGPYGYDARHFNDSSTTALSDVERIAASTAATQVAPLVGSQREQRHPHKWRAPK